jgi:tRNA(fMet)-specific endonuclease VapC
VRKCADAVAEQHKVERLLGTVHELPFDAAAAAKAALVRATLEGTGSPIGPYDTLLAGHAISLGFVLVTHNTAEFSRVAGLVLEDWQASAPS